MLKLLIYILLTVNLLVLQHFSFFKKPMAMFVCKLQQLQITPQQVKLHQEV